MPEVYDHIVSLGYDCRLAYNLRRAFGFTRAYPFDWWVTPLPALLAFLDDPSVERLYDPALLEPVMTPKGVWAIRNAHYDIELHHEFPRGEDGMVLADWPDHIDGPRSRTAFLLQRLLALPPGSRLLFVRHTKRQEGRALGEAFSGLVGQLRERLEARFPGCELLLIDPPRPIVAAGVGALRVGDASKSPWFGQPELWSEALQKAGLAWNGPPSEAPAPVKPEADHAFLTASDG
jgi:hypothetical protein